MEQIKQSIGDAQKEQAVLSSKVVFLMRASGLDGSSEEQPGEVQFPLKSDRELTTLENRLNDFQLKRLLVSYLFKFCSSMLKLA